jgi:hypothetical protein
MSNYIKELTDNLKKDKGMREAWKANIAMAYKDNWTWHAKKTGKTTMNREDRHIIANNAAEYFLKLLCDELKPQEGRKNS